LIRPKGFRKKYFTLSSIQAHSCAAVLHSKLVSVCLFFTKTNKDKDENDEDSPPPGENPSPLLGFVSLRQYLPKLTYKVSKWRENLFHKSYIRLYYGFRRSGIHPPLIFPHLISQKQNFTQKDY